MKPSLTFQKNDDLTVSPAPARLIFEQPNGQFVYQLECGECGHEGVFHSPDRISEQLEDQGYFMMKCGSCRHRWGVEPPKELGVVKGVD